MGGGFPGSAGVGAVGISEGDVDTWELLILKNVADDFMDTDVGADGEFADTI
jgi:hypothetical protein